MTTFIVDGQEKELRYNVSGIDISNDFIGNTYHGMDIDEEGRYIASVEDFEWWKDVIEAHEELNARIIAYKEQFDGDEVDQVVSEWAGNDYDSHVAQVLMGLERNFGELEL